MNGSSPPALDTGIRPQDPAMALAKRFGPEFGMTGSPFTIPVGKSQRVSFPGIDKGMVKIVSNVKIVAAVGVIYKAAGAKPTSYSEMMALPNKLLDSIFWLPWYNSKSMNTQLRFGAP